MENLSNLVKIEFKRVVFVVKLNDVECLTEFEKHWLDLHLVKSLLHILLNNLTNIFVNTKGFLLGSRLMHLLHIIFVWVLTWITIDLKLLPEIIPGENPFLKGGDNSANCIPLLIDAIRPHLLHLLRQVLAYIFVKVRLKPHIFLQVYRTQWFFGFYNYHTFTWITFYYLKVRYSFLSFRFFPRSILVFLQMD